MTAREIEKIILVSQAKIEIERAKVYMNHAVGENAKFCQFMYRMHVETGKKIMDRVESPEG